MEVEDILKIHTHHLLKLDNSFVSISELTSHRLRESFLEGLPFAYMTYHSEFHGHDYYINKNVLIPRSETELMVDYLIQAGKTVPFGRILDIGTGSGVIVLSLLAAGAALKGWGVDISAAALEVAEINRTRLRLQDRCELLLSDRLKEVKGTFNLIASNPPYIRPTSHRDLVHRKVDEFEPSLALYIADDQYKEWFHDLFNQVFAALEPNGLFMMEGHELELGDQAALMNQLGFREVRVINDYSGSPRFLQGKK